MENTNKKTLKEILKDAEDEKIKLKHPYVGSEHLLLAIIKESNELTKFLSEYNLDYRLFKKELLEVIGTSKKDASIKLYTPVLRKIIARYEIKKNKYINSDIYEDLFLCLLDEGEGIAIRIMLRMNVDLDEIYFNLKEKRKVKGMETASKIGVLLNSHIDLNEKVIGREEEINKLILTLTRKKKCNPILIGPAGVGKTAIVEEFTRRIIKNEVPSSLKDYKVIMLEMGSLVSGTKYRGEFEERLNKILQEIIEDKKTIIFIDEIHSMVNAGGADGAINASDILKPYLARGEIKCIGATTTNEYNNSILSDKALARRFDCINVNEPSKDEMYSLLNKVKCEYERYHGIRINSKMIKKILDLSDYYLKTIANPDKSIDLLDSSCAYAKINGNKSYLTENDILNTLFYKTNNSLINNKTLVSILKQNLKDIIAKDDMKKLCESFSMMENKPISILLKNSNVKEKIIKCLNNINVINIDLSSYQYISTNTLCSEKRVNDSIFKTLIDKPYTLVLFDNIDLSSKYIQREIININEKGYFKVNNEEKIYFNNAIIIANINDKENHFTGFKNNVNNNRLSTELINSFKCNLLNINQKEITL